MQDNLIKNSVDIDDSPKEDLISCNIILEVQISPDRTVVESLRMNFSKNINVRDMIKEIIPNINDSLENHNKKLYLNPESNDYQLCECSETNEGGINNYTNGNILEKLTKLQKISSRNFKLLYSPKDVFFNFQRKKKICDSCLLI